MASSFLYRLAKRVFLLDVTHLLVSKRGAPFESGQFEFRELTSNDIVRYAKNPALDMDARMADRLDFGLDYCFGAFDQSELAGYCWFARQDVEPEHNQGDHPKTGVALSFECDTAFVYKAFTRPQWRGQKVFPRLLGYASRELHSHGIARLVSTTDWANRSAMRAFERSGFESVGKIWRVARLSSVTVGPAQAGSMGIQIGTAAKFTRREKRKELAIHTVA